MRWKAWPKKETAPQARKTLSELVRLLYEGKSFSQALAQLSAVFPPLYVALVQSSEKNWAVGDALGRYVSYRQRMVNACIITRLFQAPQFHPGAGIAEQANGLRQFTTSRPGSARAANS